MLNTVLWHKSSPTQENCDEETDANTPDAFGQHQLRWLESKLEAARKGKRKVRLVMHIPPGIDAYASQIGSPQLHWKDVYETSFLDLMTKFKGTAVTSFAGHTHMDDFCVVSDDKEQPFLVFKTSPSVGPNHYNNPAFTTFNCDGHSGEVQDVTTYYLPLGDAHPSWKREYDIEDYTSANLNKIALKIRELGQAFTDWQNRYNVSTGNSPIHSPGPSLNWPYYSCAQTSFTTSAYSTCLKQNGVELKTTGGKVKPRESLK